MLDSYSSSENTRRNLATAELTERVIEAALDEPGPTPALKRALQEFLTYTKHRHRDRSRDRRRPDVGAR